MKASIWLLIAASLLALAGPALSQEIVDMYSGIDSADITVEGDVAGSVLEVRLSSDDDPEHPLQTQELTLDGPGTWIVEWRPRDVEEGPYTACARLLSNEGDESAVSEDCHRFYYGGPRLLRFDVRDFNADSRGVQMAVSARDPTIVDISYMLISDGKAVYPDREESVSVASLMPLQIDRPWKILLENGEEYRGRVKIAERGGGQVRAFMETFVAREDAEITETYEDETGASATVVGDSRVPFRGSLRFTLTQNGSPVEVIEERTPVLLTDDDETVEVSWNQTLEPGIYELQVYLLGRDGGLVDLEESVIEAENITRPAPEPEEPEESSMPTVALAVAVVVIAGAAYAIRKRRKS